MTLLFDGKNAFFAEREQTSLKGLVIHLPKNASLFVNGVCYFPTNGAVHLPQNAVRRGENALALRIENRIFPTEGLYFDEDGVIPVGFDAAPILLRQNERITALEEKFAALDARVVRLEKKAVARMLFS